MLRNSQTLHGIPFLLLGNVLYLQYYVHCLTYDEWFPLQLEEYFYCHPQGFLHEIGRDPFRQQGGDFFRHIGQEWGKIPTWSEKFRHGRKQRQGGVYYEERPFQTQSIANSRQNLSSSHGIKQVSTLSPNYHILVPVPATVVEYSSSVLIVLNAFDGKSEGYLVWKDDLFSVFVT